MRRSVILCPAPMKKNIKKWLTYLFVDNADHQIWMISAVVLFLSFGLFAGYTYQPDFNRSVNTLLWGTQQVVEERESIFHLPVTVVYNSASEDQKMRMDQFLENLTDPQQALVSTELQPKWLDAKSPEAKTLIEQSGLKYLPQIFVDPSIEQHPQFEAMKQYLAKNGNTYFIRLAPLEHLEVPTATTGYVDGADPSKAKVVIQAYESYSCDHCAEANVTLKKIMAAYPSAVSVVYKHFEPGSVYSQIAQGADCAADQQRFSAMQKQLFDGQGKMLEKLQAVTSEEEASTYVHSMLLGYAKKIGTNSKVFETCLNDKVHEKAIEAQTVEAVNYGVNGPPAFFINKRYESGLLTYDEFKTIIDEELKNK